MDQNKETNGIFSITRYFVPIAKKVSKVKNSKMAPFNIFLELIVNMLPLINA
jgi:hypothetical protein